MVVSSIGMSKHGRRVWFGRGSGNVGSAGSSSNVRVQGVQMGGPKLPVPCSSMMLQCDARVHCVWSGRESGGWVFSPSGAGMRGPPSRSLPSEDAG